MNDVTQPEGVGKPPRDAEIPTPIDLVGMHGQYEGADVLVVGVTRCGDLIIRRSYGAWLPPERVVPAKKVRLEKSRRTG